MFLIIFAIGIWIFTSFHSGGWGLAFLIISTILLNLVLWKQKAPLKKRKKKNLILIGAWGLAFIACSLFRWKHSPAIRGDFFSFSKTEVNTGSERITTLDRYTILAQSKPDTYIIRSLDNKNYLLKSEKPIQIGENYLIGGQIKIRTLNGKTNISGEETKERKDQVTNLAKISFNYDKRLLMKGYEGALYEKLIVPSGANPLLSRGERQLITTRQTIKSLIQSTQLDQYEGLLLGMLVGDRSLLSQKEYEHFIQSGIVHIIAVSGGNLVMIIIFLSGILFRIPFYPRNVIIILGVISFALIAGGDSSVIRALIMSLFSLLALFWGREINIWRLMSYAFVIMLCYNPYFLAYDLGFLLSFGALIGIIIISEQRNLNTQHTKNKLLKSARIRTPISSYMLPTLGATLGTLPILLLFIGENNITGMLINLIVVPLVPLISIGGSMALFLITWTGWGGRILPIKWLLSFIYLCSDRAQQFSITIKIQNSRIQWIISLLLISIIVLLAYQLKQHPQQNDQ